MTTEKKMYPFDEVLKHNQRHDCWLIMYGKVYDVTPFMDDHPGGDDVILSSTGKDATNDFEDIGHSKAARNMLDEYHIGNIDPSTFIATQAYAPPRQAEKASTDDDSPGFMIRVLQLLVPIMILGLAIVVRRFTKPE